MEATVIADEIRVLGSQEGIDLTACSASYCKSGKSCVLMPMLSANNCVQRTLTSFLPSKYKVGPSHWQQLT